MHQLDRFLKAAVTSRASDLHLSADEPVRLRIDGDLVEFETTLSAKAVHDVIFEILTDQEKQKLASHKNLDRSYSLEGFGNFRVNVFYTRRGMAAVLRSIPSKIPTMEELGLPPSLQKLTELPKGLVLVTGPTGSGKSTTLAAMINHINLNCKYHILTVEDPIEFIHTSQQSLINQREIGNHCQTFADALKYALREDPDVILVGEMRDLETISLALTASETGHLVFGTLHTRGAAASVDRIIDSFPANQQSMIRAMLSESLAAVISQALLKRSDGNGRVAAYEIMISNHAISNLIREGKTFQMTSVIQTGRKDGMILMDQHVTELVASGLVTPGEGMGYMEDPAPVAALERTSRPKLQTVLNTSRPAGEVARASEPAEFHAPSFVSAPAPPALSARPAAPTPRPIPPRAPAAVGMAKAAAPIARTEVPTPATPVPYPPRQAVVPPVAPEPSLDLAPVDVMPNGLETDQNYGDDATLTNISLARDEDLNQTLSAVSLTEMEAPAAEVSVDDLSARPVPEEVFETRLPEREETSTFEIPSLKNTAVPPPRPASTIQSSPPPRPAPAASLGNRTTSIPVPPMPPRTPGPTALKKAPPPPPLKKKTG